MSLVVKKALRLVDLVAEGTTTLSGISSAAGISHSTTHRLLATLVEHGYLRLERRSYRLGPRLFELGRLPREDLDIVEKLRPILMRYASETRDTIHLAVLTGRNAQLIERIYGDRGLRINSYPGMMVKALTSAVGKALVAQLPHGQWAQYLDDLPGGYHRSRAEVLDDLARARGNVAFDQDECSIGTCGVAATFMANSEQRVACSINGATMYFPDGRLTRLAPTALRLAGELEAACRN